MCLRTSILVDPFKVWGLLLFLTFCVTLNFIWVLTFIYKKKEWKLRWYQQWVTEDYSPVIHPKDLLEENEHLSYRSVSHVPRGTFQGFPSTLRFSDFTCIQGIVATLRLSRTKLTNPRKPPQSTIPVPAGSKLETSGKSPWPSPWGWGQLEQETPRPSPACSLTRGLL